MIRFIPLIAIFLVACASPKYTYYFDHYSVTAGTHAVSSGTAFSGQVRPSDAPLKTDPRDLSASAAFAVPIPSREDLLKQHYHNQKSEERQEKQVQLTAEQQRVLVTPDRKQLKQAIGQLRKAVRAATSAPGSASKSTAPLNDQATQKLDGEVIVAIAFGAVGITLSILGGVSTTFWIVGVLCLGIGIYFFVDWLSKR